eukprot:scaffold16712_cov65-Phaeocystis_antarctica.AAC.23
MWRCLAAAVATALLEQALVLARLANALLSSWACTPVGTVTSDGGRSAARGYVSAVSNFSKFVKCDHELQSRSQTKWRS